MIDNENEFIKLCEIVQLKLSHKYILKQKYCIHMIYYINQIYVY